MRASESGNLERTSRNIVVPPHEADVIVVSEVERFLAMLLTRDSTEQDFIDLLIGVTIVNPVDLVVIAFVPCVAECDIHIESGVVSNVSVALTLIRERILERNGLREYRVRPAVR